VESGLPGGKLPAVVRLAHSAPGFLRSTRSSRILDYGMSAPEANLRPPLRHGNPHRSGTRILAVDYGRKRLGLAVSDEMKVTSRPLAVLTRTNRAADLRRVREACREHNVALIVVGHPLHLSGEAGDMAEEAARFANRLHRELGMPVQLLDERLTSWESEQAFSAPASRRRGEPKDDIAAAILLREYLAHSPAKNPKEGD
jgi:putative holliday junction resolvase